MTLEWSPRSFSVIARNEAIHNWGQTPIPSIVCPQLFKALGVKLVAQSVAGAIHPVGWLHSR
jgi:hypothetical protein